MNGSRQAENSNKLNMVTEIKYLVVLLFIRAYIKMLLNIGLKFERRLGYEYTGKDFKVL